MLLQHTDCGIVGCYHHAPALLAKYLDVAPEALGALAVTDPYAVSGLVYDVATGKVKVIAGGA